MDKTKKLIISIMCLFFLISIISFIVGFFTEHEWFVSIASGFLGSSLTLSVLTFANLINIVLHDEFQQRNKLKELWLQLENIRENWRLNKEGKNLKFSKQFKVFHYYITSKRNYFLTILPKKAVEKYNELYDILCSINRDYYLGMGSAHDVQKQNTIKNIVDICEFLGKLIA